MDPHNAQVSSQQPLSADQQNQSPLPLTVPAGYQTPQAAIPQSMAAPTPTGTALERAASEARQITLNTVDNPYQKAFELERLRTNYLNTTYGLHIKQPEQ